MNVGNLIGCEWDKNDCENYYTYTPLGTGSASVNVMLKSDTYYVLKYFMYIPADAYVEDDSCYIQVQSRTDSGTEIIGDLNDVFKKQDKNLRHQWIYHEIPFYTNRSENKIIIKGPQHNHKGIIGINRTTNQVIYTLTDNDRSNPEIELHDCQNDIIHFYSIQIAEMVEYSPTIKYTKTGLYLVEGEEYAHKNLKDARNDSCTSDITATNQWSDKEALSVSDTWINKGTTRLPIPLTDIYIFFDSDFDIMYNKLTSELSYTKGDIFPFEFEKFNRFSDTELKWVTDDDIIRLEYDRQTAPYSTAQTNQNRDNRTANDLDISNLFIAELHIFNSQRKFFTTGINNSFSLRLQDAYGGAITTGKVECSIWVSDKEENTPCSEAERCLGEQEPDEYGIIEYKRLNFRNFNPSRNKYYLRVKYTNPCYKKEITKWKELIFVEERVDMTVFANKCNNQICLNSSDCCQLVSKSIFNSQKIEYENTSQIYKIKSVDEYPLRLDVKVRSQPLNGNEGNLIDEGYCELSVNDEVVQTTFVDSNGLADFYLDSFDLDPGLQTIKIEYFTKPYESVNYTYFVIHCDTSQGYDERPAIPIAINKLTRESVTQLTTGIFELEKDDIFFVDIDVGDHKDFSITIEKNSEKEIINVKEPTEPTRTIATMYEGNDRDKYIITTGNLKNEQGNDVNNTYRIYKKEFTVKWL